MNTLEHVEEVLRLPSPAPRVQPIAFDGERIWLGSWDTERLYEVDPDTWTLVDECEAPGKMYGAAVIGDELRFVVGRDNDDRYIYRFIPGHGFKNDALACPDFTGSQLAFDGDTLFLSQLGNKRILALDAQGAIVREIPLSRKPCGMTIVEGCFFLLTGDDDMDEIRLTKVDARGDAPIETDLAAVPFDARSLAYDGRRFWTCFRDGNEVVAFTAPM